MHKRGCLKRLPRSFRGEAAGRNATKFLIDKWQEFGRGLGIASLDGPKDARDIRIHSGIFGEMGRKTKRCGIDSGNSVVDGTRGCILRCYGLINLFTKACMSSPFAVRL